MENNPFQHTIVVQPEDIDDMGHVNNVVYVRYIQEVAAAHWRSAAPPALHQKYAWVVLRHEIDYKNPAFAKDVITASTWVGEATGARFERFVKLQRVSDGKVLAASKTIWCMLDGATLRPTRIGDDVMAVL